MKRFLTALLAVALLQVPVGTSFAVPGKHDLRLNGRGVLTDNDDKRVIIPLQTTQRVNIDGRLDDDVWKSVQFQSAFLQREPVEGAPATEKTEVGICFNDDYIYFGIKCWDSEADRIIAREMRRDAVVDDDDYFEIVLDTYHDQRTAFYFITNANGVRRDAMFANEGRQYNPSWDGVWQCRAEITGEGWFSEIAIPWKTLRFASADSAVWGVNFARMIRRKNEHVYWELIPRDIGHSNIFRISEAGDIYNLRNLEMGGNIELKPYLLGGLENDENTAGGTDHVLDAGLDAKFALTANLNLDLTVNTDFAQVESDEEVVNLTRFSLWYPEKRTFFLEGAEVFAFGSSGGFGRGGSDMDLFYSRRIGLADGYEARILGGAKMVGKVGAFQVGAISMLTGEVDVATASDTVRAPAASFSAVRLRRDVLKRGSLGMMFLNKEEVRSAGFNRSFGIDAYLPLNAYWSLTGYIAGTIDDEDGSGLPGRNIASKLDVGYDSDLWRFSLSGSDIGGGFNPEMGYVRRTDYRYASGSFSWNPRPKNDAVIRQYSLGAGGSYRSDHDSAMLDNELEADLGITFQNSARASIGVQKSSEYLPWDWEVRDGYLIPRDTYRGWNWSAGYRSDPSRHIAGDLSLSWGDYYTGRSGRVSLSGTITALKRLRVELSHTYNDVDLPEGRFHTNTFGMRTYYYFNTELYLKAYIQLNDDRLRYDGREKIVSNLLLRWIYSPGSNLYLVYNDGRLIGPGAEEIQNRTVMLKATFFWRK
ncbi:carbohydrate binding family 9 domain-containing protein [bacterium]|nr:carbohydrate binding family 9 domain-containing protein [bacterium]